MRYVMLARRRHGREVVAPKELAVDLEGFGIAITERDTKTAGEITKEVPGIKEEHAVDRHSMRLFEPLGYRIKIQKLPRSFLKNNALSNCVGFKVSQ